jgi:NAD(P)-dependent dehydrogenase (short-subunit alcohol dehydrogenase family)
MPQAVVTGAGRGLGRAIALDLAVRGYLVHATDIDPDAAAETAAAVGAGASSSALDVTDEQACRAVADAASARGPLDLWVNNAGILATGPAWQQNGATRRALLEVNALGTMNGTAAALEKMLPLDRGHVVNVVSVAGLTVAPGVVNYAASKHAALAFSYGTLLDLRDAGVKGVHVSAICPDGIWTPMLADKLDDPSAAGPFAGRLLLVEQVAAAVGRLAAEPRPLVILPAWRGPFLRLAELFPRISLRLLPLVMRDARRRQRRYKSLIESGKWP